MRRWALASAGNSSFEHLEAAGKWEGLGLLILTGNVTLADSRIVTNPAHESPAVFYANAAEATGLLVQRSVLEGAPKAAPGVLEDIVGNVTIDSTEILGGVSGVSFKNSGEGTRTLTLAASTVGAPPGISFEKGGVVGVAAEATGTHANVNVAIEGSILFQPQVATAASGDAATVSCNYSAVPSQIQTANIGSHAGSIACAAGASGNTNYSAEAATIFAEPLHNYNLSPSSSTIDSVPAGAIALPFGLTPSATDLAGNPRVVDGNADCVALQDKGALELQGHSAACPGPVPITTVKKAPAITALSISPGAFHAAPHGATISRATHKKFGAKISWRDSQAATAAFTVLRDTAGRRQGKSCRKPSKSNRHGRRCTLQIKVGTFAHIDKAGADTVHFSGRLKGRRLPAGVYTLREFAHNAAGNGVTVAKGFKVI
jgi:hypothetical protein